MNNSTTPGKSSQSRFKVFIAELSDYGVFVASFEIYVRKRDSVKSVCLDHRIYGHIFKFKKIAGSKLSVK